MVGKFCCVVTLLSLAVPAWGDVYLSCYSPDQRYHVTVYENRLEGEVRIDGSLPRFGELKCTRAQDGYDCWSKNVADAGYSVSLRRRLSRHMGSLSEVRFTGERRLANLICEE